MGVRVASQNPYTTEDQCGLLISSLFTLMLKGLLRAFVYVPIENDETSCCHF